MNQEQIEKMATILACGNCGRCSWDCPEDEGLKCYVKEAAKPTASLLANKGYINGTDFVEWLKHRIYVIFEQREDERISRCDYNREYGDGMCDARDAITQKLTQALQEYLNEE